MTDTLEVRLLRWSDNSNSGQTVTFLLPEGEVHPFKGLRYGKTGERFAMALARIEDEQTKADHVFPDGYVEGSTKPEKTEGQRALIRAINLCKNPDFQQWIADTDAAFLAAHSPFDDASKIAADWMRVCLRVQSRRDIAADPAALERFLNLEAQFKYKDTRR